MANGEMLLQSNVLIQNINSIKLCPSHDGILNKGLSHYFQLPAPTICENVVATHTSS